MRSLSVKRVIAIILVLAVLAAGVIAFTVLNKKPSEILPVAKPEVVLSGPTRAVIGRSVGGREITAHTYGTGTKHLVFVGGVHGGYEWNSVLLPYEFMDYLDANPEVVPKNLTVTVIPSANPDGVYKVTGKDGRFTESDVSTDKEILASGRFNANKVDLNRNFDCKWQPKSMWQSKTVSAGTGAFSEPEAKAVQSFVLEHTPVAVVFWHSKANAVYASECEKGILSETLDIMNAYAKASGYTAVKSFDSYEVTGDAEGWLASINIPAITVELKTHETVEWERNLAGIKALFEYYRQ
ncbi:MAG: M14 family metallopeptidase [bacterium]|nr:M14 family metallopeptidase [bacterium]